MMRFNRIVILNADERLSLFKIVGKIQEKCKGIDFNELALHVSIMGIILKLDSYQYRISPPVSPPTQCTGLGSMVFPPQSQSRFEHLLQNARCIFPGLSFQEVHLSMTADQLLKLSI